MAALRRHPNVCLDVRFGSLADMNKRIRNVRLSPRSGQAWCRRRRARSDTCPSRSCPILAFATTIELAVARKGSRGLSSTAVQGLAHQGKEASSPSRFTARRSRRLFCPLVRANIGHRPVWELPRSQRFAQQKEQVLVARVVVKGLVEALNLGARTFEHLGKIGIAEEKRSRDLGGL